MSEDLEKYLKEKYGEDPVVPFDDDDTKEGGEYITQSGKYSGFISAADIRQSERKKDTKTKKAGSKFNWLNLTIEVKNNVATQSPMSGSIWPSIRYEPGFMREYEMFCIATKCTPFSKDSKRYYYPQSDHEHGGAVGMPIMFDVEMGSRIKRVKDEITGEWNDVTNEAGEPVKVPVANVTAYHIWDTDERYVEEKKSAPVPDSDLVDGFK